MVICASKTLVRALLDTELHKTMQNSGFISSAKEVVCDT